MDAVTTAGAVAVALALVEVIKLLISRVSGGQGKLSPAERSSLFETERLTKDLHQWHAPSAEGRQDWKGTGQLLDAVRLLTQDVRDLVTELRAERKASRSD